MNWKNIGGWLAVGVVFALVVGGGIFLYQRFIHTAPISTSEALVAQIIDLQEKQQGIIQKAQEDLQAITKPIANDILNKLNRLEMMDHAKVKDLIRVYFKNNKDLQAAFPDPVPATTTEAKPPIKTEQPLTAKPGSKP